MQYKKPPSIYIPYALKKAFNVKKFTYDLLKKEFWQESKCPNTYLLHHYQMASGETCISIP